MINPDNDTNTALVIVADTSAIPQHCLLCQPLRS